MSDAVIYKDQNLIDSKDKATHAIIIAVGDYPHLNDGSGTRTQLHGSLGQLSSPAASAKTLADWMLSDFNNPDKPLASLSMLVSDDSSTTYNHQRLASVANPPRATYEKIKKAVRHWKSLGDLNEENLVLFFFCGHGVARGIDDLSLLLEDYGEDDVMPMDGALDFAAFQRGMAQCAASHQCFFVDACRSVNDDIARNTTQTGNSIIQDNIIRPFASKWKYAVFYATLEGEAAYGRKNKPSFYTEELIKGLNGAASDNREADGKWRISTGLLNAAIHWGLKSRGRTTSIPISAMVEFNFHELTKEPVVPVAVYCNPRSDNAHALLSYGQNGNPIDTRDPDLEDWLAEIPVGFYDFSAEIDLRKGMVNNRLVHPPHRSVELEVKP